MPPDAVSDTPLIPEGKARSRWGDTTFRTIAFISAGVVILLTGLLLWKLWSGSLPTIKLLGWKILLQRQWNADNELYGALPFIYGTLVTSAIALVLAVPLSVFTAMARIISSAWRSVYPAAWKASRSFPVGSPRVSNMTCVKVVSAASF